jgi:ATP-dependent DNA helicase RecQ
VLRGEIDVAFREEAAPARRRRERVASGAPQAAEVDERLWQALRAERLALARAQGVPPYVIFHDATLLEMARQRPRDRATLSQIPGVGRSKLERYGDIFLNVIATNG